VETLRFESWQFCGLSNETERANTSAAEAAKHRVAPTYFDIYLNELRALSGVNFTDKLVSGDIDNGLIELLPTRAECRPLYIKVFCGEPIYMSVGNSGNPERLYWRSESGNTYAFSTQFLRKGDPYFERLLSEILDRIRRPSVETTGVFGGTHWLSTVPDSAVFSKSGRFVKFPNSLTWSRVVNVWAPWNTPQDKSEVTSLGLMS
jgi:hypothetical protein